MTSKYHLESILADCYLNNMSKIKQITKNLRDKFKPNEIVPTWNEHDEVEYPELEAFLSQSLKEVITCVIEEIEEEKWSGLDMSVSIGTENYMRGVNEGLKTAINILNKIIE